MNSQVANRSLRHKLKKIQENIVLPHTYIQSLLSSLRNYQHELDHIGAHFAAAHLEAAILAASEELQIKTITSIADQPWQDAYGLF